MLFKINHGLFLSQLKSLLSGKCGFVSIRFKSFLVVAGMFFLYGFLFYVKHYIIITD